MGKKLNPQQFVKTYYKHALQVEYDTGLPLEISLTQGALESGWNEYVFGNAFFGEKIGKNWNGKKQLLKTKEVLNDAKQGHLFPEILSINLRDDGKYIYEVRDWFKAYDSPEDSFRQHAKLLTESKRYKPVIDAKPDIYKMFKALQECGYATATNYASSLIITYDQKIKPHIEKIEATIKTKKRC